MTDGETLQVACLALEESMSRVAAWMETKGTEDPRTDAAGLDEAGNKRLEEGMS